MSGLFSCPKGTVMSKKVWSLRKRAATRVKATVATVIVLLVALVALAAWGIWRAQHQPDTLSEVTATAEPTAETATVTVDGEGVATDVTVTVVDPDTGLTADDAAGGLDGQDGEPGTTTEDVGDTTTQTVTESNVQLPITRQVLVEPGQQVTVTAQNGTGGGDITTKVTIDGQTTSDTGSGYGAVAETTGVNE
jgi:hypothetical protein